MSSGVRSLRMSNIQIELQWRVAGCIQVLVTLLGVGGNFEGQTEFSVGTVNFWCLLTGLWSTATWWRRARFSNWSTARERKIEHRVPKNVVRRISIASIGGGL
jgi:hypothetical protein